MEDFLKLISSGGTGGLIVALCLACWLLWRRLWEIQEKYLNELSMRAAFGDKALEVLESVKASLEKA